MSLIQLVLGLIKVIGEALSFWKSKKDIELGERREKERQKEANKKLRDNIDAADPDSVSDDDITR